jgi:hypothetical protein
LGSWWGGRPTKTRAKPKDDGRLLAPVAAFAQRSQAEPIGPTRHDHQGRGAHPPRLMASWLKNKQDAGEDIEEDRISCYWSTHLCFLGRQKTRALGQGRLRSHSRPSISQVGTSGLDRCMSNILFIEVERKLTISCTSARIRPLLRSICISVGSEHRPCHSVNANP